jgi:hypothetical protein
MLEVGCVQQLVQPVYTITICTLYADMLCMVSETSYAIQVGFIQSDIFSTIILIVYLFNCETTTTSLQN